MLEKLKRSQSTDDACDEPIWQLNLCGNSGRLPDTHIAQEILPRLTSQNIIASKHCIKVPSEVVFALVDCWDHNQSVLR